ncbi:MULTISPECIES: hypothetical protein [Paenibacillus]|uniref:Uncharacterized protein n=1 Tax=Paenibacillus agri TaxID=2744309 RepID=A0A850EQZ8_9BACL|nr:hypothetical protein [Paenibacillus agri]NUU62916.1 hypothetical protein [Paenibacillus agri]
MSMPNIPDIKPNIILNRKDVINLLLTSIALEEIGFSHIINAEAEKIQHMLKDICLTLDDALRVNDSVEHMLRGIVANQILLQFKLSDVLKLERSYRLSLTEEECEIEEEEEEE